MRASIVLVCVLFLLFACWLRKQRVTGGSDAEAPDVRRQDAVRGITPGVVAVDRGINLGGGGNGLDNEWESVNKLVNVNCSSVFVGSRVLLTARHCLSFGSALAKTFRIEYVPGQKEEFDCLTKAQSDPPDLAVCLAQRALAAAPSHLASVDLRGMSANEMLLFSGASVLGGNMNAAPVRGGWSVTESPLPPNGHVFLRAVRFNGSDLASACEGDSGGGAFRAGSTTGARALVGIVRTGDCGNPRSAAGAGAVNLGTAAAKALLEDSFKSWIESDGSLRICGFNANHSTFSACKETS